MRLNRAFSLLWTTYWTAVVATDSSTTEDDSCGIYMATSSTSTVEQPTWGLYAGKDYDKDVPVGPAEVAIHTFNLMANSIPEAEDDDTMQAVVEFVEQFIWVPHSSGGQFETEEGRIVTAISGAGIMGGYNAKLTNADWNHSFAYSREAWNEEPGVAHPGRGAYSNYFNVGLRATDSIPAGMEIFVNYGENWEDEDEDSDKKAEITREDHQKIDETIDKMIEFFDKHSSDLDPESKQEIYNFLIKDVMSAAAGGKKGAKIANMLPSTPDKLVEIKEAGGSLRLGAPTALRSLEWLQENGKCMDNIRAGPSTIPHAGRGAIAARNIKAGSMVAPVPLVQIPNEHILDIHPLTKSYDDEDEEYFKQASEEILGQQLLANYCWGHPDSTLQFFPAGAVVPLINHSKEPNAKMVWSEHPNHHQHWFELDPEELIADGNQHLGLLMEIVATKDIQEGEEVFIDYGNEWAAAWEEHVKEWEEYIKKGDLPSPWPIRALDLNQEYKTKPFETAGDASWYPKNVELGCFLMVTKPKGEPPINDKGEKVRVWTEGEQPTMLSENLFVCSLVDRKETEDGSWSYTVAWKSEAETTLVREVPHKAIVFWDKPETSDQFTSQSFRHYIGIPDDVFPQGPWRNVE